MKRLLLILFASILSIGLIACGDSKSNDDGNDDDKNAVEKKDKDEKKDDRDNKKDNDNPDLPNRKPAIEGDFTPEEEEYIEFLSESMMDIGTGMFSLADVIFAIEAGEDVDDELTDLVKEIDVLIDEAKDYKDIPKEYEEIHAEYLDGLEYYQVAIDGMPKAFEDEDLEKLEELVEMMDEGNAHIEKTAELLEDKFQ